MSMLVQHDVDSTVLPMNLLVFGVPEQVARHFIRARTVSGQPLLESLTALGHAQIIEGGRFAA
jgi:hypothetical protein